VFDDLRLAARASDDEPVGAHGSRFPAARVARSAPRSRGRRSRTDASVVEAVRLLRTGAA
jgi:hypothetical protein